MKTVQVSSDARKDLAEHFRTSVREWGAAHAREYFSKLRSAVMRLNEMPSAWPWAPDVRPELRRMIWRNHIVYFRETDTEVQVLAVLHGRQDAASALEDRT
ncbi:MAG: type II toxin-antitoxin system RelE/ParE family toxin [Oceanicaulis sp.]